MYLVNNYIANPTHRIKVALVGVGGTGSFVLPELVGLSKALKQLGRKELDIHVYDADKIEEHNVGRQKFFPSDVGLNKAEVLVNRVNRAYQSDVKWANYNFTKESLKINYNIIITCVDKLKVRKMIHSVLNKKQYKSKHDFTYYWIDAGNSRDFGQVVLATYIENPKSKAMHPTVIPDLPSIIGLHPDIKEDKKEPTCSLRASLLEQSFMINKLTGVYVLEMLSSLLLDFNILHSQVYFSLNPINVKTNVL